jgi:hypothetical protein
MHGRTAEKVINAGAEASCFVLEEHRGRRFGLERQNAARGTLG